MRPPALPSSEPFSTEEVSRHLACQVKKKWARTRHYTTSNRIGPFRTPESTAERNGPSLEPNARFTTGNPNLWQDYFSPLTFLANHRWKEIFVRGAPCPPNGKSLVIGSPFFYCLPRSYLMMPKKPDKINMIEANIPQREFKRLQISFLEREVQGSWPCPGVFDSISKGPQEQQIGSPLLGFFFFGMRPNRGGTAL